MPKQQVCDCLVIHQDAVEQAAAQMPSNETLVNLANLFKLFGDGTRLRILSALCGHELCVCDISHLLGMSQSAISHQLRALKEARLVKNRKEGKVVYYSLDDAHVQAIFETGLEHIQEER